MFACLVFAQTPATDSQWQIGEQFIFLGNATDIEAFQWNQKSRKPDMNSISGRIFTVKIVNPKEIHFSVDNGLSNVILNDPNRQAGLRQLQNDLQVSRIQNKWQGKTVWGYGGIGVSCASPFTYRYFGNQFFQSGKIERVDRIYLETDEYVSLAGGFGELPDREGLPDVVTGDVALIIRFGKIEGLEWTYGAAKTVDAAIDSKPCSTLIDVAGDEWHLERLFSLYPPSRGVPRKTLKTLVGLTKWQLAWLQGFPNATQGTVQQLLKMDAWAWASIPFAEGVRFKNGKVVNHNQPRLP
jgi:hypothetical protein